MSFNALLRLHHQHNVSNRSIRSSHGCCGGSCSYKTRQPHNFKWDEETDLLFLKAVLINKAYIRSNEKLEIKWLRVNADLSKRTKFIEQGFQVKPASLTLKLKLMIAAYEKTYASRNLSARPEMENMSGADLILLQMCEDVEKLGEEVLLEKNTKKQKKRTVGDITDAIYKEGAKVKDDLQALAANLRSGEEVMLSAGMTNFAKFALPSAVTPMTSVPKRKRGVTSAETEEIELMESFSAHIQRDQDLVEDRMRVMEKQIKESGDATTSAIVASAKESAVANAALLAVMTAMSNNFLRR